LSGTLSKAWWLLALCGILDTMHAGINLLMTSLPLTYGIFGSNLRAVRDMGLLALAAGACAIAAGLCTHGKDHGWLLSLHGLALGAFGVITVSPLVKGPLSFRPVSLLFMLMAASLGAFALATAKAQPRGGKGRWFLIGAGAASISFAFSFIAVGFFFRLEPPQLFFIWMSSYFALCAVFFLWLAVRLYSRASGQSELPSPRHAH
jgi:uncharacterized membrane protein HdeD (DUF308 family)